MSRLLDVSAGDEWATAVAKRIGAEVKRLRGNGRSAQWLSERCAELGYPIGRATISEIEVGRRKTISVPELIVLAEALGVPPVQVLYPGLPDGDTEYLPGQHVSAIEAVLKFSEQDDLTGLVAGARQLYYARSVQDTFIERMLKDLYKRGRKPDADELAAAREHSDQQRRRVDELEARLRTKDGAVVRDA